MSANLTILCMRVTDDVNESGTLRHLKYSFIRRNHRSPLVAPSCLSATYNIQSSISKACVFSILMLQPAKEFPIENTIVSCSTTWLKVIWEGTTKPGYWYYMLWRQTVYNISNISFKASVAHSIHIAIIGLRKLFKILTFQMKDFLQPSLVQELNFKGSCSTYQSIKKMHFPLQGLLSVHRWCSEYILFTTSA